MAAVPRTKIVATIGPSSATAEVLDRMIRAGMNVARINLAHGTHADHAEFVHLVRGAARRAQRPVAVMVDLGGPKIRIGDLVDGKVVLATGRRVTLTTREVTGTAELIGVNEPRLVHDLRPGDPIFLADGTLELRALRAEAFEIECEIVSGGILLPQKGVNLPKTRLQLPSLTTKDRSDLANALRLGVDVVALSFARTPQDIHRARRAMGTRIRPLIAKIEKREAIHNLEAILDASDGVMVARGDLAVETSLEEVPLLQKRIIARANAVGKPVITATQMLLSMVDAPRPTRAEAADVANAILDGTDAVMLSEETARGKHPARVVETMARIALRAETALDPGVFARRIDPSVAVPLAVSEAAVHVARDVGARAIVTPTFGGATPRFVARLRPPMPVVALSENAAAVQFLCLTWGVHPVHKPRLGPFETTLRIAGDELMRLGLVRPGEAFVVTAGFPRKSASNLMTVQFAARVQRR